MTPTGMEEVLALESAIRAALPKAKGKAAEDGRAILAGRWPTSGTRLAALREIVGRMGQ